MQYYKDPQSRSQSAASAAKEAKNPTTAAKIFEERNLDQKQESSSRREREREKGLEIDGWIADGCEAKKEGGLHSFRKMRPYSSERRPQSFERSAREASKELSRSAAAAAQGHQSESFPAPPSTDRAKSSSAKV